MEEVTSTTGRADLHRESAPAGWTSRFFSGMAFIMLLLNLVGFAPTYFFKAFFDSPTLQLRTHIHGALFTSWFVLFALQTSLVAHRRVVLHRRLGLAGVVVAAAMVMSGLVILYFRALEYDGTAESLAATTTLIWANLGLLALFAGFALLGFARRGSPYMHRHLMLFASIAMMGQSLGRMGRFPVLRLGDSILNEVAYGLGGLALLILAVCLYDLSTRRRLHPVTLFGGPTILGVIIVAAAVLPTTGVAQALVLWLNN